ncbi:MAG: RES family NAD+ phosphorylase [Proteobacteria bacterium]|nr:RES family NAD+ phosphorylase [Pseudomonadota bacterium]
MIHDPQLLDELQKLESPAWEGRVWRHMFGDNSPMVENTRGARWNPTEVPAIYASADRSTAIAEADYRISLEPLRPRAKRTLYELRARLQSVLDITSEEVLGRLGLGPEALSGIDWSICQHVGGAAAWLEHDGLLVPSARAEGSNLVIYPNNTGPGNWLEEISFDILSESEL